MNQSYILLNAYPPALNWHEDFIVHLASIIQPQIYVELGLYQCAVFNRIIPFAQQLIGIDIEPSAGKYMHKSPKTHFLNTCTQDYVKQLQDESIAIDMLFIDADHSAEAVLRDFQGFFPFISPHGLILLHDTHPENELQMQPGYSGTAYMAVEELMKQNAEYEMITIPVPPGLTICRKRSAQLSWK